MKRRPEPPPQPDPTPPPPGPGFPGGDPAKELAQGILSAVDDIARLADRITQEGAKIVAAQAIGEFHYAVKQFQIGQFKRSIFLRIAIVVGLLAIGAAGDRWLLPRPDISGMTCQDQDGGRVCGIWVVPPKKR